MKTKIKNWLENHEYLYGTCLLIASVCTLAFGGAYFGAKAALADTDVVVNIRPTEEVDI
jgi:hypothetical protein